MIPIDPERILAISYAPSAMRKSLEAVFALDDTLGGILRTTREPIVGQMRLTWWYEALVKLESAPPPAEPILQALHREVLPAGVSGADLAAMTDGWEALLEPELDTAAIERFALDRGARVFEAVARLLDVADTRIPLAGRGWALANLSQRLTDSKARVVAAKRATTLLDEALHGRWPRRARTLGAMALSAQFDIAATAPPGSPVRVGRLALHRLTGY